MKLKFYYGIGFLLFIFNYADARSKQELLPLRDTTASDTISNFFMPQITILGYSELALKSLPGTYSKINAMNLRQIDPLTANEILRKVPGLHVVDEEGAGLRINIGIRGLDPDRSRNVLILEDGIPIALNPYGEPEMYFTPSIDRMSGVEVLKGSGQILFGPQTTGGVINFISADPPETSTTHIRTRVGQGGLFSTYASHGNTIGKAGFIISALHKRADDLGSLQFHLTDINAKFKFELSDKSRLGVKVGYYDELSNSTYIGLTQSMFDRGDQDFVRIAPDDLLPVKRVTGSITHEWSISPSLQLKTTAFGYTITRNWRRQDFSSNPAAANQTGVIWGDPSIPGGALFMLNTTGNRNRQFEVAGIESSLKVDKTIFERKNELIIGARLLHEKAYEQFIIGAKPDASAGNIRDNEVRTGRAFSFFIQDQLNLTSKWSLNAGLRIEQYEYERHILRGRFVVNGQNTARDTSVLASNSLTTIIPGIGFAYQINTESSLFGGVHRGFAPPRVKDAITSTGIAQDLDAEISTNYELGVRTQALPHFNVASTLFYTDFDNQIIPISISSGNVNATGLANGGQTRHSGIEFAVNWNIGDMLASNHQFMLDLSSTYVRSLYSADRFIGQDGTNVRGNLLPYSPEWTFWGGFTAELDFGLGFNINSTFVSSQFTDEINSILPSADGRNGKIEARNVIDAGMYYRLPKKAITLRLNVKNLTDERFIASRRPQGIRVGLPRWFLGGVDFSF